MPNSSASSVHRPLRLYFKVFRVGFMRGSKRKPYDRSKKTIIICQIAKGAHLPCTKHNTNDRKASWPRRLGGLHSDWLQFPI